LYISDKGKLGVIQGHKATDPTELFYNI